MSKAFAEVVAGWTDPQRVVSVYAAPAGVSYSLADARFEVEDGTVTLPAGVADPMGLKRIGIHPKVQAISLDGDGNLVIVEREQPALRPKNHFVIEGIDTELPDDVVSPTDDEMKEIAERLADGRLSRDAFDGVAELKALRAEASKKSTPAEDGADSKTPTPPAASQPSAPSEAGTSSNGQAAAPAAEKPAGAKPARAAKTDKPKAAKGAKPATSSGAASEPAPSAEKPAAPSPETAPDGGNGG